MISRERDSGEALDKEKERISNILDFTLDATTASALAAIQVVGEGDKILSDQVAVNAMEKVFLKSELNVFNTAAEGVKDKSYFIDIGWQGDYKKGSPTIYVAEDSLECTKNAATGKGPSSSVLVASTSDSLFPWPDDLYANRLVAGPLAVRKGVHPTKSVSKNLQIISSAHKKDISDLKIVVLKRDRNNGLIEEIKASGVNPILLLDGDLMPAVNTCLKNPETGFPYVDAQMGIGGGTESLLSAVAVNILGGGLWLSEWRKKDDWKIKLDYLKSQNDMAGGEELVFCATGVTPGGDVLKGITKEAGFVTTHSLLLSKFYNVVKARTVVSTFKELDGYELIRTAYFSIDLIIK